MLAAPAHRLRLAEALVILSVFFISIPSAFAGPLAATLKGVVRDNHGSATPGVIVTLTCGAGAAESAPIRIITRADGGFTFKGLDPIQPCSLRAEIPGYATVVVGPLFLKEGKITQQDIRLISSEDATEVVLVEGRGSIVDTESSVTSTTLDEELIEGLPIVGRSFQDILTLAAGVTDVDGDGNPNVHGARDTGLQYRLDGADITDPLTGHFGQYLNLDAIQEVEVITSGAGAENSRADGGFARIVTKSGGNGLEGAVRLFFRSRFLDHDGAGNQDMFVGSLPQTLSFRDLKAAYTLGGPIVKDHLWYFGSVQSMDIQTPVSIGQGGASWIETERGYQGLAKLTWQASPDNKVSLQSTFDPRRLGGLGLGIGVFPESDFTLATGAVTTTLRWMSILSPTLLMETTISRYDGGQDYTPVSGRFRPTQVVETFQQVGFGLQPIAYYPCNRINCFRSIGPTDIYQIDQENQVVSGPFYYDDGDQRVRGSLRSELTLSLDDALGSHTLKAGAEFTDEYYHNDAVVNPVLFSSLKPPRGLNRTVSDSPFAVIGTQTLLVFDPVRSVTRASGGGMGAFVQDAWKPLPNLTLSVGARLDVEIADAMGMKPFAVRKQAREALRRFDMACDLAGVLCEVNRTPGKASGGLPYHIPIPPGNPLERFDVNEDGYFDSSPDLDGKAIWGLYTTPEEREPENFSIRNRNLAPRLSVSWDPWNDGRTRLSGTFGRYYDRLFLGSITAEQDPGTRTFTFAPGSDPTPWIAPGDKSFLTSTPSFSMVARDLATPYQDERTLSIEREVAPEWSIRLTAVHRTWKDLLQDIDVNHITCDQYRRVLGVDPHTICGQGKGLGRDKFGGLTDPTGGGEPDPVGTPRAALYSYPNGAVDLYNLNPNFDQVFKIGNYNGERYGSFEVAVNRRLHRNWQMQASYTLSSAKGDAEDFLSFLGDDPSHKDDERGYLDYDQRHVVKLFSAAHLPRSIILGWTVVWASGTPYSVVAQFQDLDDTFNVNPRTAYVTGHRNDQRNGGSWTFNSRVEKGFKLGATSAEAFFSIENILNSDDLTIHQSLWQSGASGRVNERRRFGRRFELGMSVHF